MHFSGAVKSVTRKTLKEKIFIAKLGAKMSLPPEKLAGGNANKASQNDKRDEMI